MPESHPCSALLPEGSRRCIILQKVEEPTDIMGGTRGERRCILIGSNQLLATFTKNDLKWIGSLGIYLSLT